MPIEGKIGMMLLGGVMKEVKAHPWTALSAGLALALGLVAMATHASTDEFRALKDKVEVIQVSLWEKEILDTRVQQCVSGNKKFYTDRLQDLLSNYYRQTGRQYRVPDCAELT